MITKKLFGSLEIFLLVSFTFAIAFILNAGFASSAENPDVTFERSTGIRGYSQIMAPPSSMNVPARSLEYIDWRKSLGELEKAKQPFGEAGEYKAGGLIETGYAYGSAGAHLIQGVVWAGVVYGIVKMGGSLFGMDDKQSNSLGLAAVAGVISYKGALALFGKGTLTTAGQPGGAIIKGVLSNTQAILIGVGVAVAVFILMYKKETKKLVTYECLPWEAPLGGAKCAECNNNPFAPCSEYRCKALGQACEIVNPGTEEEKCVWVNPKDVTSPTIQPSTDALKPQGLKYVPDTTIRPPNRGVKIVKENGDCLQAYTPLEFGIMLNEPAQCKIDYDKDKNFEEMQYYFGESNYLRYNHTERMSLPAPADNATDSPLFENDGTFNLFVRCQDANGNVNEDAFVFNFCVDKSPDTTPPVIITTSVGESGFVQYQADKFPIQVYVNEPAECKWSRQSKSYADMENTMTCNQETYQINADLTYTCKADLTGIENNADNKFYFRCKDNPGKADGERNTNVQSYELTLKGTQPLSITKIEPNETVSGSTETVSVTLKVETDDGAEEGNALCYFSTTGLFTGEDVKMFDTGGYEHSQELGLGNGNYRYYVQCIDSGGNSAKAETSFTVFVDKQAPKVTRVYKDLEALKIVTNEDAECVYSIQSCNYVFAEGLPLIYSNPSIKDSHYIEWESNKIYYIKCRDDKGNEPSGNVCSVVVNPIKLG